MSVSSPSFSARSDATAPLGDPESLRWGLTKIFWSTVLSITWGLVYFTMTAELSTVDGSPIVGLALDQSIPFVPATVWLYLGGFFFFIGAPVLLLRGRGEYARFVVSIIVASTVCFSFYAAFPIAYPRPEVDPLGAILGAASFDVMAIPGDHWSGRLVHWLYSTDPPICIFPSFHVTEAVCATLALRRDYPRLGLVMAMLTVVLMVATWTTKQHFLVDGFAGIACGWFAHRIAFLRIEGVHRGARVPDPGMSAPRSAAAARLVRD